MVTRAENTVSQFYNFSLKNAQGQVVPFSQFQEKVVVIVNVASLCGYSPQYHELEALYQKYKERGLVVLAFPCNQFAWQEPGTSAQIEAKVRKHFKVTFPIMEKVEVNGDDENELYTWLKDSARGQLGFKGVWWNFEKFLVDRRGNAVVRHMSAVTPYQFEDQLVTLLEESTI